MSYTIAGKKILNEYIALGVYGLTGLGAYAAMSGGSKDQNKVQIPDSASAKANSTSDEEAAFIQNFINDLEHEEKSKAGAH